MSDQLSKVELKPCPFCGVAPVEHWHKGVWREHYLVHCPTRGCPARPGTNAATGNPDATTYSSKDEASCAWNRRIESAAAPVEVDKECAEFVNMVGDEFGNEVGVRLRELFATLARQLAEANSELANLRAANIAYASEVANLYGRAGLAESQLAEATRRLGEVEGLVGKWRNEAERFRLLGGDISIAEAAVFRNLADELEQLTKEPTK